jgi:CRISPR-associated endonuclease/helicase Cas3
MAPKAESDYVKGYYSKNGAVPPLIITNSYHTAAENFHVIESKTTSVLVPYKKGEDIITALNGYETIEDLTVFLRKAQHYSINLYSYELDELTRNNGLASFFNGDILALKEGAYSEEYGFEIDGDSALGLSMF